MRLWVGGGWRAWLKVCCNRLGYHLVSENPEIDLNQGACKICKEHAWSDTDLALILCRQGKGLGRQRNVDGAIAKFQQALELDPTLDLNPEVEARRQAELG